MSIAINANPDRARFHSGRLSRIAGEYASAPIVARATKTTLPAMSVGNESFDGSQRVLMELAGLTTNLAANITTLMGTFASIDQNQSNNFRA